MLVLKETNINNKKYFTLVKILLAGCTHVTREVYFSEVQRLVEERIPQTVYSYQGGEEDKQALALLNVPLKEPLIATYDEILFLFAFIDFQVMEKN